MWTLLLIAATLISALIAPLSVAPAEAATETTSNWKTLTDMPTARGEFGVAVVAGKIYVIGGVNENNQPLGTVEEYNPLTDAWTNKMSMPTPRSGLAVAVYNNKIYAIGGSINGVFVGNNEVYDPVTNTWSTKSSMPTPRADLSASVVNNEIFLIGGKKYSSTSPFFVDTDVNECYFPENDTWSQKAAVPTSVLGYASAVLENKIYIIGGSRRATSTDIVSIVNTNQVYDPRTDQWTQAAPLPITTNYGAAAATTGTYAPAGIYFIGGSTAQTVSAEVMMYHLSNNSWVKIESMPTARGRLGVAVVSDVLYVIGGFDGTKWLKTNEQYKPVGYGTVAPIITITSPENKTYQRVTLDFTLNRGAQWMGYSLDGQANVTVTGQTRLSNLAQGGHHIVMFANDSAGNMGISNSVYFSIDTEGPVIVILNPANQSYDSTDILLEFTVSENATLAYSLDGQTALPIVGNLTLVALSNGGHRITIYATDQLGNTTEETVYFNIAPFPFLTVIAAITIAIIIGASGFILIKRKKPDS